MAKNAELVALQRDLIALNNTLLEKMNSVEDVTVREKILAEMYEVSFRVTTVGQQLFKAKTDEMDDALGKIEDAEADLKQAIAQIEQINDFIKTISQFLGLVDTVVDIAKLL